MLLSSSSAIGVCISAILAGVGLCQTSPPAPSPAFEVASIKPSSGSDPNAYYHGPRIDGARFEFRDATLVTLIGFAYRVPPDHVSGAAWLDDARFDVVATLPAGAAPRQTAEMILTLLRDRFQLVAHKVEKSVSVYALKVAAGGVVFKKSDPTDTSAPGCRSGSCGGYSCRKQAMGMFVQAMSQPLWQERAGLDPLPVLDSTDLAGLFDFDLPIAWETDFRGGKLEGCARGYSAFAALKALGLILEKQKQLREFVVVDNMLRVPIPN